MKNAFTLILTLLAAPAAYAQGFDTVRQPDTYLQPEKQNAYGPGIHSDATGRPFRYETEQGERVTIEPVKPDAYGPGVGMDVYGRPVRRAPAFGAPGLD